MKIVSECSPEENCSPRLPEPPPNGEYRSSSSSDNDNNERRRIILLDILRDRLRRRIYSLVPLALAREISPRLGVPWLVRSLHANPVNGSTAPSEPTDLLSTPTRDPVLSSRPHSGKFPHSNCPAPDRDRNSTTSVIHPDERMVFHCETDSHHSKPPLQPPVPSRSGSPPSPPPQKTSRNRIPNTLFRKSKSRQGCSVNGTFPLSKP
mmetsp:Transcript_8427/g.17130  ORF Transcript_8427/g.17130 Transcript_8427/m.17130 type:complete len:207 (-) Transcript_8427:277-897(-)